MIHVSILYLKTKVVMLLVEWSTVFNPGLTAWGFLMQLNKYINVAISLIRVV